MNRLPAYPLNPGGEKGHHDQENQCFSQDTPHGLISEVQGNPPLFSSLFVYNPHALNFTADGKYPQQRVVRIT